MSQLPQDDLDDVIKIATKAVEAKKDYLSQSEVDAIAEELGITPEAIRDAQLKLKTERAEAAQHKANKRRYIHIALACLALCLVGFVLNGLSTKHRLDDALIEVRKAQSQLINVMERQRKVVARWATSEDSRDKTAELAGAENRVRIQRKRYDAQASGYNRKANGLLTGVWCGLFGLPNALPLASDPKFQSSELP